MNGPRKFLGVAIFIISLSTLMFSSATNVYITPTGASQGICTSNPQSPAWFNSPSNWGSGSSQIGAGTNVHLCGSFTGSAGATLLTFQGSGTSSSPITLTFEANTSLAAPYWGSSGSGAINTNRQSGIVIDGGSNGIIQNTQDGTGLTYQQASIGVYLMSGSNITVQNLTIANICQHTSTSDNVACNSGGNNDRGIIITGGVSNITIQFNTIHDSQNCIEYSGSSSDSGILISKNTISRCNWGIGGYGASNGLTIDGNDISSATNWDTGADSFHHNGIILFPQSVNMNNVVISNNYIHDINGTETGHIFLDPNSSGNLPGVAIYNNVTVTSVFSGPTNCFIEPGAHVTPAYVFNNTMSGASACGTEVDPGGMIENNIFTGMYSAITIPSNGVTSDYNDFYGITGGTLSFTNASNGINASTLTTWVADTSSEPCIAGKCDQHSISTNPNLTSAFMLNSGSPAIGAAKNLTSLGIQGLDTGAPQFFGVNYACGTGCQPRSSSGAWDIGAYPASGGSSPAPPTGLSAQVQ